MIQTDLRNFTTITDFEPLKRLTNGFSGRDTARAVRCKFLPIMLQIPDEWNNIITTVVELAVATYGTFISWYRTITAEQWKR